MKILILLLVMVILYHSLRIHELKIQGLTKTKAIKFMQIETVNCSICIEFTLQIAWNNLRSGNEIQIKRTFTGSNCFVRQREKLVYTVDATCINAISGFYERQFCEKSTEKSGSWKNLKMSFDMEFCVKLFRNGF